MEKFTRSLEKFERAYRKFREAVDSPLFDNIFTPDIKIEILSKRFEYTYEAMWKAVKEFLRLRGIECNSPKSCFKELLKEAVAPPETEAVLSEMILLRNQLVHVYDEEQAREIFDRIKQKDILQTFEIVLTGLKENKP